MTVIGVDAREVSPWALREGVLRCIESLSWITGARMRISAAPVEGLDSVMLGVDYKAARTDEICIRFRDKTTLELTGDQTSLVYYQKKGLNSVREYARASIVTLVQVYLRLLGAPLVEEQRITRLE